MTLSLDDVRNKRFRMARKSGYEVLEVDEFVDEVEESFAQVLEENRNLKSQVEALKATAKAAPPAQPAAPEVASRPAVSSVPERPAPASEPPTPETTTPPVAPDPTRIVVTTAKEASSAVVRLVELSTEQAERLVAEATDDANRILNEASQSAEQVTNDARARAEQLDQEVQERRRALSHDLGAERDQITRSINDLRRFEVTYRTNMANYLRKQIETVESGRAEPEDVPAGIAELSGDTDHAGTDRAGTDRAGTDPASTDRAGTDDGSAQAEPAGAPASARGDDPTDGRDSGPAPSSGDSETPRLDALLGERPS
jgi:DivIVA domain-containing protein